MEEPGDVEARFFFGEYLRIGDEKVTGDIFYRKLLLTFWYDKYIVCVAVNFIKDSLLFRVVEIQRICEATATPFYEEGANLSESSNNKRIEIEFKTVLLLGLSLFLLYRLKKS